MRNLKTYGIAPYSGAKAHCTFYARYMNAPVDRVVDVCAGALNLTSLALQLDYKTIEVNDIDPSLVLVYKMIRDKQAEFIEAFCKLDVSRDVFADQKKIEKDTSKSDLERAVATYYLLRYSFSGLRVSFSNKPKIRAERLSNRLKIFENLGEIHNTSAFSLIASEIDSGKSKNTLYILDPPYSNNRAGYKYNIVSEFRHELLSKLIQDLPYVILCGSKNDFCAYDRLLDHGWERVYLMDKPITLKALKKGEKPLCTEEYLWIKGVNIGTLKVA